MSNFIRITWMSLILAMGLTSSCKNEREGGAKTILSDVDEDVTIIAVTEYMPDLTMLQQEAVHGLRLTAEVLDKENWLIGLSWENVGDVPISLPMSGLLKGDIDHGYAAPFFPRAYSFHANAINRPAGVILDKGKHSDGNVFDFARQGEFDDKGAYEMLRKIWGLQGSIDDAFWFNINQYLFLGVGEKRTCFLRFPRYKSDDDSERWEIGDRIPVDFRYFVGDEVPDKKGVTITSGENGEPSRYLPPSAWRGEVFSNVVYLHLNSGGERVRWPTMPGLPRPAEPDNNTLMNLEIIDEEAWIVRVQWKNIGDSPLEIPVNGKLYQDINSCRRSGKPFPFASGMYDAARHYGRIFGTALEAGNQSDEKIFNLSRDGNFIWNEELLEKNGFFSGTSPYVAATSIEWLYLPSGATRAIDFKFPRYESDDRVGRWQNGQKVPIELCFKAGEISNSSPPYRDVEEEGQKIRRRFPAWRGEVFSNVVFFTWSSEGERMKW